MARVFSAIGRTDLQATTIMVESRMGIICFILIRFERWIGRFVTQIRGLVSSSFVSGEKPYKQSVQ
jgi:hypothetical protein